MADVSAATHEFDGHLGRTAATWPQSARALGLKVGVVESSALAAMPPSRLQSHQSISQVPTATISQNAAEFGCCPGRYRFVYDGALNRSLKARKPILGPALSLRQEYQEPRFMGRGERLDDIRRRQAEGRSAPVQLAGLEHHHQHRFARARSSDAYTQARHQSDHGSYGENAESVTYAAAAPLGWNGHRSISYARPRPGSHIVPQEDRRSRRSSPAPAAQYAGFQAPATPTVEQTKTASRFAVTPRKESASKRKPLVAMGQGNIEVYRLEKLERNEEILYPGQR